MKIRIHFLLISSLLATLATPSAFAAESAGDPAGSGLNLWGLLQQGGWAMYPLGIASLAMFFLIFYSFRETNRKRFIPETALPQLSSFLAARDLSSANLLLNNAPTVLSRCLKPALMRARPDMPDANKTIVEGSLAESLEHEENLISQWINYLNVVATISPMIGLLGTVSGMIGAFQTISSGGMGRPELLAGDIGEALITTATGLVIGIPAMIAYFILRNRLDNVMLAVSQSASLLIDQLSGEITAQNAPQPEYEPVEMEP